MNVKTYLRTKFIAAFLLVIAPLVGYLYYVNHYGMNEVREKASLSTYYLLNMSVRQIDTMLDTVDWQIYAYLPTDQDLMRLQYLQADSVEYMLAKYFSFNGLINRMAGSQVETSYFIYDKDNRDLIGTDPFKQSSAKSLRDSLLETLQNRTLPPTWTVTELNGEHGLLKLFRAGLDSPIYVGVWIEFESIITPLTSLNIESGMPVAISGGTILTPESYELSQPSIESLNQFNFSPQSPYKLFAEDDIDYVAVGARAARTDLNIFIVSSEQDLLTSLLFFQRTIALIPAAAAILLIGFIFFLQKVLIRPMSELVKGMRSFARGGFDTRMDVDSSGDFRPLAQTFNSMVQEISELKIHVYEESLKGQRAEFKQLQLQINPHFFMNCLSIIYSLGALRDYASIQKMALHMGDYFRYIIHNDKDSIPLKDELSHIRNYLEIQKLRFPDELEYELSVDGEAEDCPAPPLIAQPLVENAIVHGFSCVRGPFRLNIEAKRTENERIEITIQDNGAGFAPGLLQQLNRFDLSDEPSDHVGIWNIKRRLLLHYGHGAGLEFKNAPDGGAFVRLTIPYAKYQMRGG